MSILSKENAVNSNFTKLRLDMAKLFLKSSDVYKNARHTDIPKSSIPLADMYN
jgi:hypothetical protein